jgi:hypothetical protein
VNAIKALATLNDLADTIRADMSLKHRDARLLEGIADWIIVTTTERLGLADLKAQSRLDLH